MSIQLLVVLSIFSIEKPARSYCQDLIKDLKASSPDGYVLHLLAWCADHAVDDSGRHDVSHEGGNRAVCPVDCNDGHHSGAPDQAEYRHDDRGKFYCSYDRTHLSFLPKRKRSRPKGPFAPRKASSKSHFMLSPKQHNVNSLGIASGN